MKTIKLYEIRKGNGLSHSTRISSKLRTFSRARKLVSRLRRLGFDAFVAPVKVVA